MSYKRVSNTKTGKRKKSTTQIVGKSKNQSFYDDIDYEMNYTISLIEKYGGMGKNYFQLSKFAENIRLSLDAMRYALKYRSHSEKDFASQQLHYATQWYNQIPSSQYDDKNYFLLKKTQELYKKLSIKLPDIEKYLKK